MASGAQDGPRPAEELGRQQLGASRLLEQDGANSTLHSAEPARLDMTGTAEATVASAENATDPGGSLAQAEPDFLEVQAEDLETAGATCTSSNHQAYDSTTLNSSSRSLYAADDLDYVEEHGRRYCKDYSFPNDVLEQDRMRVVHQVYLHLFDLELTTVPLVNPKQILDVGTGTGEWAIGMAEAYPDCEVTGVDISALAPSAVPHNAFFEVDDCEVEWMRAENSMDLVHLRNMSGAFSDWSFIYRQAFACLKPGGFIELIDFDDYRGARNFYSRFPPDSDIHTVARQVEEGAIRSGRRRGTHHMDESLLTTVGYVDIDIKEYTIPLNPMNNSLGKLWLIACLHGIEAGALRLLTKYMGWDPSQARAAFGRIRDDFKSLALNPESGKDFNVSLKVTTARKPSIPGHISAQSVAENGQIADYSGDDSTIGG